MTNKIGKKVGSVQPYPLLNLLVDKLTTATTYQRGVETCRRILKDKNKKNKLINGICFVVVNSLLCEAAFLIKTSGFIKA